jgi:DNA-binding NarL/FixJ family response regulator
MVLVGWPDWAIVATPKSSYLDYILFAETDMLRILVVDDHDVVRRGIVSLLTAQPDFQIAGEAGNGFEAVDMAEQLQPDIVVLDIGLPGLNGLEAAQQIRRVAPHSKILFFTQHAIPEMVRIAMNTGAAGYVCKSDAVRELVTAIYAVAEHQQFFSSSCAVV